MKHDVTSCAYVIIANNKPAVKMSGISHSDYTHISSPLSTAAQTELRRLQAKSQQARAELKQRRMSEAYKPARTESAKLITGASIPLLGLGTWCARARVFHATQCNSTMLDGPLRMLCSKRHHRNSNSRFPPLPLRSPLPQEVQARGGGGCRGGGHQGGVPPHRLRGHLWQRAGGT